MFCVVKPLNNNKTIFEQRGANDQFIITQQPDTIAYPQYFTPAFTTYINGILNTTITTTQLQNKKHLITVIPHTVVESNDNYAIFAVLSAFMNNFNNMYLYKFIGFKEKLTEEQIQYVIKKYNLLDGVDKIQVS